jgi:pantetheine-phosphate adenylyltransferase
MKKAIISGSFDPITIGHLDLIVRASQLFDEVYVAVGENPDKSYTFNLDDRIECIVNSTFTLKNVIVIPFSGLLAEFAYDNNIQYVVRGIRNSNDLQYENTLAIVNSNLKNIETIYLPTKPQLQHISSSATKAIVKEFGNVEGYTTLMVKSKLEQKIWKKTILCLVGVSGSGKSVIGNKLTKLSNDITFINMDKLGHHIYESSKPYAINIKNQLILHFGHGILNEDGSINRKVLGSIVFNNKNALDILNMLMKPAMRHLVYEIIRSVNTKYIIFEGAVIPENGFLPLFNNQVVLLTCDEAESMQRAADRDNLPLEAIQSRYASQGTTEQKRFLIQQSITSENYGTLIEFNSDDGLSDDKIEELWKKIQKISE